MIYGQNGGQRFRSAGGGGQWALASQTSNNLAASGNVQTVKIPQNMAADFRNRQWNMQVPAIGVRVQGTLTNDLGAATLKCSRLQRGSFVNVQLDTPKLTKKYYQTFMDLARWSFAGELVNGPAMQLDQHMSTPGGVATRGIHPEYLALPDNTLGAGLSTPLSTFNPSYFPGSRTDAYWRQLEGLLNVQAPGASVAQTVDDFFVIPLCAYMGDLVADSIPLDTLCDYEQPWQINCQMNRTPEGNLIHVANGGAFSVTTVSLYVFAVPLRPTDKRVHGMPWQFRNVSRSAGDLKYNDGEVVLFSGTLPATTDTNVTDTVDAKAYRPGIVYGEFSGDFAVANYLDWYIAGQNTFPKYYKDRGPRHLLEEIWNRRNGFQTVRYPGVTGTAENVLRSARAFGGTTPPTTQLAPNDLSTLLGMVSPYPCRMVAVSALEMKGFPGFGSLDAGCGAASVKLEGNWDFSSGQYAYNSLANMVDIVLNNDATDRGIIEDLGQNCCKNGTVTFLPTIANPDSPSSNIVAGKITSFVQSVPDAVANAGAALMNAGSGTPQLSAVAPKV